MWSTKIGNVQRATAPKLKNKIRRLNFIIHGFLPSLRRGASFPESNTELWLRK